MPNTRKARNNCRRRRGRTGQLSTLPASPTYLQNVQITTTLQQSMELVKTAITAVMLEIVHKRKVFPLVEWQNRRISSTDVDTTYQAFIDGNSQEFSRSEGDWSEWHIPQSGQMGKDPRFDKFLKCVEDGAHDALAKRYLSKLQLSFHTFNDQPMSDSNILESYIMVFDYPDNTAEVPIDGQTKITGAVTLLDAKSKLLNFVDDICRSFLKHKNPLPSRFRMNLSMMYHEDTPLTYQAELFRHGDEHTARLFNMGNARTDFQMTTGHHNLYFDTKSSDPQQILAPDSYDASSPVLSHLSTYNTRLSSHGRTASRSSDVAGNETQPSVLEKLRGIGTIRNIETGTQDTQLLNDSFNHAISKSIVDTDVLEHVELPPPPYTQEIIEYALQIREHKGYQRVECQCPFKKDTQDLMQCHVCHGFLHARCYGYNDNEYPSTIVCYTCLCNITGDYALETKLGNLCCKRYVVHCLRKMEFPVTTIELTHYLGMFPAIDTVQEILDQLKEEGCIESLLPSTEKRNENPSQVHLLYGLVRQDDAKLAQFYFNPRQHIEHFLAISYDTSSEGTLSPGNVTQLPLSGQHIISTTEGLSTPCSEACKSIQLSGFQEGSSTQDASSPRSVARSTGNGSPLRAIRTQALKREGSYNCAKRPRRAAATSPWFQPN